MANVRLPNAYHAPPELPKAAGRRTVTGAIRFDFCNPVFSVCPALQAKLPMAPASTVPKVTVNEHGYSGPRNHDIWRSRQRGIVRSKAQIALRKDSLEKKFRLCVLFLISASY